VQVNQTLSTDASGERTTYQIENIPPDGETSSTPDLRSNGHIGRLNPSQPDLHVKVLCGILKRVLTELGEIVHGAVNTISVSLVTV
jgi:hypothetical protein